MSFQAVSLSSAEGQLYDDSLGS